MTDCPNEEVLFFGYWDCSPISASVTDTCNSEECKLRASGQVAIAARPVHSASAGRILIRMR